MKTIRLRVLICLISSGAFAASLAHGKEAAADWNSVLEGAKQEGKVVLYSQEVPDENTKLKAGFEKAYPGIRLEIVRIVENLPGRIDQERTSGSDGADAVITAEPQWVEGLSKAGLLKPMSGPSARSWPSKFIVGDVGPVVNIVTIGIAYNTKLVQAPIAGYQDLLKPEFLNKIGTSEPIQGAVVAWYDWLERTQGQGYLAKLAAQHPKLYVGTPPETQAAAAGEIAIAALAIPATTYPLIQQGAPLKFVVPSPSLGNELIAARLAWAKHPNGAALLMDYMTSRAGQAVLVNSGQFASALPGIPDSPDVATIQLYDFHRFDASSVAPYREEWNKLFKAAP